MASQGKGTLTIFLKPLANFKGTDRGCQDGHHHREGIGWNGDRDGYSNRAQQHLYWDGPVQMQEQPVIRIKSSLSGSGNFPPHYSTRTFT